MSEQFGVPAQSDSLPPLVYRRGMRQGARNALRHWREHRPKMYTRLHNEGTLINAAIDAYEATVDDEIELSNQLIKQGWDSPTAFVHARQIVRDRYVYLPTEEDVPELSTTASGVYIYLSDQTG